MVFTYSLEEGEILYIVMFKLFETFFCSLFASWKILYFFKKSQVSENYSAGREEKKKKKHKNTNLELWRFESTL